MEQQVVLEIITRAQTAGADAAAAALYKVSDAQAALGTAAQKAGSEAGGAISGMVTSAGGIAPALSGAAQALDQIGQSAERTGLSVKQFITEMVDGFNSSLPAATSIAEAISGITRLLTTAGAAGGLRQEFAALGSEFLNIVNVVKEAHDATGSWLEVAKQAPSGLATAGAAASGALEKVAGTLSNIPGPLGDVYEGVEKAAGALKSGFEGGKTAVDATTTSFVELAGAANRGIVSMGLINEASMAAERAAAATANQVKQAVTDAQRWHEALQQPVKFAGVVDEIKATSTALDTVVAKLDTLRAAAAQGATIGIGSDTITESIRYLEAAANSYRDKLLSLREETARVRVETAEVAPTTVTAMERAQVAVDAAREKWSNYFDQIAKWSDTASSSGLEKQAVALDAALDNLVKKRREIEIGIQTSGVRERLADLERQLAGAEAGLKHFQDVFDKSGGTSRDAAAGIIYYKDQVARLQEQAGDARAALTNMESALVKNAIGIEAITTRQHELRLDTSRATSAADAFKAKLGELFARLTGGRTSATDLAGSLAQIGPALAGLSSGTTLVEGFGKALSSVAGIAGRLATPLALGAALLTAVGVQAVAAASQLEKFQVQYEVMLGSADEAAASIARLEALALKTPFPTEQLIEANRQLMIFMGAGADTAAVMQTIGDVSAFTGAGIDSLARDFGRMYASIKEGTGEMSYILRSLRLMGALPGPAYKELQKLEQQVKSGSLSMSTAWSKVLKIFDTFGGTAEKMSATFAGAMQRVQNTLSQVFEAVGTALLPIFTDVARVVQAVFATLIEAVNALKAVFAPLISSSQDFASLIADDVVAVLQLLSGALKFVTDAFTNFWKLISTGLDHLGESFGVVVDFIKVLKDLGNIFGPVAAGFELLGAAIALKFSASLASVAALALYHAAGAAAGLAFNTGFAAAALVGNFIQGFLNPGVIAAEAAASGATAGAAWGNSFAAGAKLGGLLKSFWGSLAGKLTVGVTVALVLADKAIELLNLRQQITEQVSNIKISFDASVATDSMDQLQQKALALQEGIRRLTAAGALDFTGPITGAKAGFDELKREYDEVKRRIEAMGGSVARLGTESAKAIADQAAAADQAKNIYENLPKDVDAAWKAAITTQQQWQNKGLLLSQTWSKLTSEEMRKGLADPRSAEKFQTLLNDLVTEWNTAAADIAGVPRLDPETLFWKDEAGVDLAHMKGILLGSAVGDGAAEGFAASADELLAKELETLGKVQKAAEDSLSQFQTIWAKASDPKGQLADIAAQLPALTKALTGQYGAAAQKAAASALPKAQAAMVELLKSVVPPGTVITPENAETLFQIFAPDQFRAMKLQVQEDATDLVTTYFATLEKQGVKGDDAVNMIARMFPDAIYDQGRIEVKKAASAQMFAYIDGAISQRQKVADIWKAVQATWAGEIAGNEEALRQLGRESINTVAEGIQDQRQAVADAWEQVMADVPNLMDPKKEFKILMTGLAEGRKNALKVLTSGDPVAESHAIEYFEAFRTRMQEIMGPEWETLLTGGAKKAWQAYETWLADPANKLKSPEAPKIPKPELPPPLTANERKALMAEYGGQLPIEVTAPAASQVAAATAAAVDDAAAMSTAVIGAFSTGATSPASLNLINTAYTLVGTAAITAVTKPEMVQRYQAAGATMAAATALGAMTATSLSLYTAYGYSAGAAYTGGVASAIWAAVNSTSSSLNQALAALRAKFYAGSPPGPRAALFGIPTWGQHTAEAFMTSAADGIRASMPDLDDALGGVKKRFTDFAPGMAPVGFTARASGGPGGIPRGMGSDRSVALLSAIAHELGIQTGLQSKMAANDPKKTTELSARSALASAVATRLTAN